jgi:dihydrolipoamide dehydrogenase
VSAPFDLVIIGSGPGGYVTAIHAAQHGLKTALIEASEPGGVCLHAGCIPTKTLLASVDLLRQARQAASWGITIPDVSTTLPALTARRQKVVQQLAQGVKFLLDKNQVTLIRGRACLRSANEVEVFDAQGNSTQLLSQSKAIVLATGSRPSDLPVVPRDGVRILNSNDMFQLQEAPDHLAIVGGGYIGCEFACFFAALGSRVTVIEGLSRLLPQMEVELGQALERSLTKTGIRVLLNAQVTGSKVNSEVQISLADGQTVNAPKALVAVGRGPNTARLGLENAGVQFTSRGITVNEFLETNVPGIFAIGDVTGTIALAHVASAQGRLLVDNIIAQQKGGRRQPMNYEAIPACVFTHPEISSVGLTEEAATQRGLSVKTSRVPISVTGKSLAMGATEGFVKLVADAQSGRLLGGHVIGAHAAELVTPLTLAVRWGLTIEQLNQTVYAHPTISEAIHEAVEGVFGRPTHLYIRKP